MQIIRYDAMLLEESVETELVDPMKSLSFPQYANTDFKFHIHTREPDAESMIDAYGKAYDMGLRLDAQQLRDLIGSPVPEDDAEVLDKMEQMKAEQEAAQPPPGMGGMPPGMMPPGANGQAEPAEPVSTAPSEPTEQAEYVANGIPSEKSDRERLLKSDAPRSAADYAAFEESAHSRSTNGEFAPDDETIDNWGKQKKSIKGQQGLFEGVDPGLIGATSAQKKKARRNAGQKELFFRRQVLEALR